MNKRSLIIFLWLCFFGPIWASAQSERLDSLIKSYPPAAVNERQAISRAIYRDILENPKQAISNARGIKNQPNYDSPKYLALLYYVLASAYEVSGNYDSATLYIEKALNNTERNDFPLLLGNEYNLLGIIHDIQGDYDLALQNFFQALAIWEESDHLEGVNTAYTNIGNIYSYQHEFQNAINYYQKSVEIAKAIRDTIGVTIALNNIGSAWQELDSSSLAMYFYQRSFEVAKQQGDEQHIALPLDGISRILLEQGELDEALTNATYLLEVAQKYQNVNDQIYAYLLLAEVYWSRGNQTAAIQKSTQGYKLAKKSGATLEINLLSELLADYHYQRGNFQDAYKYQSVQLAYQDSIFSVEKRKIINDLERTRAETEIEMLTKENQLKLAQIAKSEAIIDRQTAYTVAVSLVSLFLLVGLTLLYRSNQQRKQSNQLLSQQKEEIAQNNEQLTQMNNMLEQQQKQLQHQNEDLSRLNELKNKLLSIISHDFRSPLSSLQGVISMLNSQALSPGEIKLVFEALSIKVENTTNMLDNLLKWTRNQMQGIRVEPTMFALPTLVEDVINSQLILADKKEVILNHNVPSPLPVFADSEMVRMVLRNLISNAIKFTLKGDSVTIKAQSTEEGRVLVSVIDTGLGISPDDMQKLFQLKDHTTYGTANEKGTGLGLIICREFVEKNGGEIWVESEKGQGSTFYFTLLTSADQFPVYPQEGAIPVASR